VVVNVFLDFEKLVFHYFDGNRVSRAKCDQIAGDVMCTLHLCLLSFLLIYCCVLTGVTNYHSGPVQSTTIQD